MLYDRNERYFTFAAVFGAWASATVLSPGFLVLSSFLLCDQRSTVGDTASSGLRMEGIQVVLLNVLGCRLTY